MIARLFALLALAALCGCATPRLEVPDLVEQARRELGLPGMAAAVWRDGRIVVEVAAGERAAGSGVAVAPGDPFHIGSATKPFTAALAARLAERGMVSFEDRIADRLAVPMRPEYRDVTLGDLLVHRGGLVENPRPEQAAVLAGIEDLPGRRAAVAAAVLSEAPAAIPRKQLFYSNFGYVVAAAMIEAATGRAYEVLLRELVLEPLGLSGAGFGAPGTADAIDAPRGHLAGRPLPPDDPRADNPAFANPSGGLHLPMAELARFGGETLLRRDYHGWLRGRDGARFHDGTNLRWYALVRIHPDDRVAVAIAANALGDPDRTEAGFARLAERLRRLAARR